MVHVVHGVNCVVLFRERVAKIKKYANFIATAAHGVGVCCMEAWSSLLDFAPDRNHALAQCLVNSWPIPFDQLLFMMRAARSSLPLRAVELAWCVS